MTCSQICQEICQIKVQHNNEVAEIVNYIKYLNLPVISSIFKTFIYTYTILYYDHLLGYIGTIPLPFLHLGVSINLSAESTNSSLY